MTTDRLELPRRGQPDAEVTGITPGDLTCFSVTTILKAMGSEGLIHWAAQETTAAAVDGQAWQRIRDEQGRGPAIRYLADARWRPRPGHALTSAQIGTVFHAAAEDLALDGHRPTIDPAYLSRYAHVDRPQRADVEAVTLMLDAWERWLDRAGPTFEATEVAVFSPRWGYAGTCDGFLTLGGIRFIFDYKTALDDETKSGKAKRPFADTVALQLAAYARADLAAVWRARRYEYGRRRYYLLSADERAAARPVPQVDHGLAIQVTPVEARAYPVTITDAVHRAFLHVAEVFRWREELADRHMGDALMFPDPNDGAL